MRTRSLMCAAILIAPHSARSQDDAIGTARPIFDTSPRIEANDNFGMDAKDGAGGAIATQNIRLSFLSETRNQTLRFTLGAFYQPGEVPDTGIGSGWRDPVMALDATCESIGSALSLSVQHESQELGLGQVIPGIDELEDGTLTPTNFVGDYGTLVQSSGDIGLELGRTAPLGLTFGANYNRRAFRRTSDIDLFDRTRQSVSSALRINLSPSLVASLSGELDLYRADDDPDTRRETRTIRARLDGQLDPRSTVVVGLSHSRVTTDETLEGGRVSDHDNGLNGEIVYAVDLPCGDPSVTLASKFTSTGRRTSLTFGRALGLPAPIWIWRRT